MTTHTDAGGISLSRTLGLLDITMIGVGAMIGAGIFVLTGIAAGVAGPALVLAFFLNGIVTTFTALSYAELGSSFPEAGGGYLWVKEGMSGTQGFLAGWMSWFAHAVACSLYGLGFGRFALEIWHLAGLPTFGLSNQLVTLIFMVIIVSFFSFINFFHSISTQGKTQFQTKESRVSTMYKEEVPWMNLILVLQKYMKARPCIYHIFFLAG